MLDNLKLRTFVLPNRIMVLGGYGNFGKRISKALAAKGIDVLIVGRSFEKSERLATEIGKSATPLCFDVPGELGAFLAVHRPDAIINTVGPFQHQGYETARIAIAHGVHYVDLADGREFVCGISELDASAKKAGVAVISGASTVPALSDAVVREYRGEFSSLEQMRYGISPGQGAERGLATTQGILSYVGKPLSPFPSIKKRVFGWQNLYRQFYPGLGNRWMANCEIPDLDLLPQRHDIKTIQFSAGLELAPLHLGLWAMSWVIRFGVPIKLQNFAGPLLKISNWFNGFGSSDGGMHVLLSGKSASDPKTQIERSWFIIAKDGDGPHIPTIPAILLAQRIAGGDGPPAGAYACVGLVSLTDYVTELQDKKIEVVTQSR